MTLRLAPTPIFVCLMGRAPTMAAALVAAIGCATATPARAAAAEEPVEAKLRFAPDDEAGNESKAVRAEILIQKSEKKALIQLTRLVKKNVGQPIEPDLLFRLAELYMRRARSERFFEAHRDSELALRLAPDIVQDASEQAEIRAAIAIYEDVRKRYPKFDQLDVVTFNEAFAQQQLGRMDEAEALFAVIPEKYPRSSVAPDAWLSMGEISYQKRQFGPARERLLKVKDYPGSRAYPYALYKAAWCLYNLQDAPGAMKQLEEVVAFGREAANSRRDAKLDLRKEALGDLAIFYGDAKPASSAVAYFEAQAEGLDPAPYIMRLVEIYKRHSRYGDVEIALKDFLAKHPGSDLGPGAQEELVWNYERALKRPEAIAELERFERMCAEIKPQEKAAAKAKPARKGRGKAAVAAAAEPPRVDLREACRTKAAEASKKLAGKWHTLWKKRNPTDDLAASAERAYALYFRVASATDAESPQARYAYGELLFQRAKYRQASEQYAMAAAANPPQPLAHDAAYASIVSLEKAVEPNKWSDEDEKRFGQLGEAYVKANPNGSYVLDVRFKRGFIAYEKERYDEAGDAFKKIGWGSYPPGPKVDKAQDLWLDVLNVRKDYKGLKEASRGLLDRPDLEAGRRTSIEKIYRQAYFSEIQAMEEKGQDKQAVGAYKAFAMENRASDLAPRAWWNASQLMFRMGDAQGGASACYQMQKLFPGSPNAKDCLTKSAQTFEAIGRLDLAARVLLNLAMVEKGSEDKWRELAADFFALSGGRPRAIAIYEKLAEGKPPARRLALAEKVQALRKAAGDRDGYRKSRTQIAATGLEPQASAAAVEEIEERLAAGEQAEAFNAARKILARDGASKETLSRARFVQAQVLEDEFRKQSVKARPERLALVLAMKTEKLEKAQSAYQSTIKYGNPRSTAKALRRLAVVYRTYAEELRSIPAPAGASPQDAEAFKGEIERLATPLEEKGVESLAQALEAAKKAGMRDGTVGEIKAELDWLNSGKADAKKPREPAPAPARPGAYVPRFTASVLGGGR